MGKTDSTWRGNSSPCKSKHLTHVKPCYSFFTVQERCKRGSSCFNKQRIPWTKQNRNQHNQCQNIVSHCSPVWYDLNQLASVYLIVITYKYKKYTVLTIFFCCRFYQKSELPCLVIKSLGCKAKSSPSTVFLGNLKFLKHWAIWAFGLANRSKCLLLVEFSNSNVQS